MSIKDHVNMTVPRMRACSAEWVLEIALGALDGFNEDIGMKAIVRLSFGFSWVWTETVEVEETDRDGENE